MSDVPELTCGSCQRTFFENQLSMKQFTIESCPHCGEVQRKSEGWGATNIQALYAGEVAAIDSWLDEYTKATGHSVSKEDSKENKLRVWNVSTDYDFSCTVTYQFRKPGSISVRFVSEEEGETIFAETTKFHHLCASHALEPYGSRCYGTNIERGAFSDCVWGVEQLFSIDCLCGEMFAPLFERLNAAMKEARSSFLDRA